MKRLFLTATLLLSAAALLVNCSNENLSVDKNSDESTSAITFSPGLTTLTRGLVTGDADTNEDLYTNIESSGFGIFGYFTGASAWSAASATPEVMYNTAVTKTDDVWSYSPLKYWESGNYSFFAYAPHGAAGLSFSPNSVTGSPKVNFELASTPEAMVDLVADQIIDCTSADGEVAFTLDHMLTRISFTGSTSFEGNTTAYVTITDLKILAEESSAFYDSATYNFGAESGVAGSWSNLTLSSTESIYSLASLLAEGGSVIPNSAASSGSVNVLSDSHYLFLLPPNGDDGVAEGDSVKFELTYTVTDGQYSNTNTITFSLGSGSMKQGVAYNFSLSFSSDATDVSAIVVPWSEENGTIIPDNYEEVIAIEGIALGCNNLTLGEESDDYDYALTLSVGETANVVMAIAPNNATESITWSTSDVSVATVVATQSGIAITGVAAGGATITGKTSSGFVVTIAVTVTSEEVDITDVELACDDLTPGGDDDEADYILTLDAEQSVNIGVTITPYNATESILWSSSNESVATVATVATTESGITTAGVAAGSASVTTTESGITITGVAAGSVIITGKSSSGFELTIAVTVTSKEVDIKDVELDCDDLTAGGDDDEADYILTLDAEQSVNIGVTITPYNATESITWSTSDGSVATVVATESGITITGVAAGSANITGESSSGFKLTIAVDVNAKVIDITDVTFESDDLTDGGDVADYALTIYVEQIASIGITIVPSEATESITWSTSDGSVATVVATESGIDITGVAAGSAIITGKSSGSFDVTIAVTVVTPEPYTTVYIDLDALDSIGSYVYSSSIPTLELQLRSLLDPDQDTKFVVTGDYSRISSSGLYGATKEIGTDSTNKQPFDTWISASSTYAHYIHLDLSGMTGSLNGSNYLNNCFYGYGSYMCKQIVEVIMPSEAESGYNLFYNCTDLETVVIPNMWYITGDIITSCTKLTTLKLLTSNTNLSGSNYNTKSHLDTITSTEDVTLYLHSNNYAYVTASDLTTGVKDTWLGYKWKEIIIQDEL